VVLPPPITGLPARTLPGTLGNRISTMAIRTTTIRVTTIVFVLSEDFKLKI
jgi:hypothetical protein